MYRALVLLLVMRFIPANSQSLVEQMGYPEDAKLLIIHADDLAVAHSENAATFRAVENGNVNSASVMMPCPWITEVAEYKKAHPDFDLGLHLTLTSEWKNYKWGPVSSVTEATSIINQEGHFFADCVSMAQNATAKAVESELRAQIELALGMGIDPTHFDSHMGCLFFSRADFFGIYLKLGRDYRVPTMISRDLVRLLPAESKVHLTEGDVIVDRIISAQPEDFDQGFERYYTGVLDSLDAGVNVLLIHTAFDDNETQAITVDHPDWGAAWRQADYDFFSSEKCSRLLDSNNIQLVTWREIRDKVVRRE